MSNDTMKDAISKLQTAGNCKIYTTQFLHHIDYKERGRRRVGGRDREAETERDSNRERGRRRRRRREMS